MVVIGAGRGVDTMINAVGGARPQLNCGRSPDRIGKHDLGRA